MRRISCLKVLAQELAGDELVLTDMLNVSTEWHSLGHRDGNLYNLQMGIPFSVGLGLALALPDRRVVACQGDGSLLENLGILAEISWNKPRRLLCIVFDNGCYEAVGGHPTPTSVSDLAGIARECGFPGLVTSARNEDEVAAGIREALADDRASLVVCKIEPGRADVEPLALYAEVESTCRFVRYVEATEQIRIANPNQSAVRP